MTDARHAAPRPDAHNGAHRKVLYAEIRALPEHADEVAEMLTGLADDVRREPGNLLFQVNRMPSSKTHFFVYEEYADQDAFDAHISAEHSVTFNNRLTPLVEGGSSALTWLDPVA